MRFNVIILDGSAAGRERLPCFFLRASGARGFGKFAIRRKRITSNIDSERGFRKVIFSTKQNKQKNKNICTVATKVIPRHGPSVGHPTANLSENNQISRGILSGVI
jgi:hypothetical protein